ncbi:MAG: T9SS type A sorting domain-containing protein [Bacteroidia bacterium]|nr:T9SS type A sorting domain-containing protein [Bacteroidia bacterium]
MKKIYTFILLLASIGSAAQSLTPTVLASSGGFSSNGAGMLSYTIGELAAVTTLSSANNFLTQGFQQPSDFGVYVPAVSEPNFSMNVYPNPSEGLFYISIKASKNYSLNVAVYDMLGKKVFSPTQKIFNGNFLIPIDLSEEVEGIYLLECVFTNLRTGEQFRNYSKLNLVY